MSILSKILKSAKKKSEEKTGKAAEPESPKNKPGPAKTASFVGVLRSPHLTEKSGKLGRLNQYAFKTFPAASKRDIKKAVESRYGAAVGAVNVLNMPGKERRRGKQVGWKSGHKKAIVTLKEGQSIEIV